MTKAGNQLILVLTLAACVALPVSLYVRTNAVIAGLRATELRQSTELAALRAQQAHRAVSKKPGKTLSGDQYSELLRLRGEIGQLRRDELLAKQTQEPNSNDFPPGTIPRANYANVGYSSPASAIQTAYWAATHNDRAAYFNSLSPKYRKLLEDLYEDVPPDRLPAPFKRDVENQAAGYRILEQRVDSNGDILLKIFFEGKDELTYQHLKKIDGEWKIDGGSSLQEFEQATPMND